jgi:hypothetical protein
MIGRILVAVVTLVTIDLGFKWKTGKHLHEHAFNWWCELNDEIKSWLHQNQNLKIRQTFLEILIGVDNFVVRAKQTADTVTISCFGVDERQNRHQITTREVSRKEALVRFPEIQHHPVLLEELSH